MKRDNWQKGMVGEEAAAKFLKKKNFKILKRNFRNRYGEVDIVAEKNNRVIFVEVKTKFGEGFGEPWEMVGRRKLGQIKRMGKIYLSQHNMMNSWCRIDVVGVWMKDGKVEKIEHWEDVRSVDLRI